MSQPRTEIKVGFFVSLALLIMAVLLLQFSKGNTLFRQTYTVVLDASNVGGLRNKASVLMSGVQVGTVNQIKLIGTQKDVFSGRAQKPITVKCDQGRQRAQNQGQRSVIHSPS